MVVMHSALLGHMTYHRESVVCYSIAFVPVEILTMHSCIHMTYQWWIMHCHAVTKLTFTM